MKSIILLSGGIDSTVLMAHANLAGRECYAVSFDYGQRHRVELESAKAVANYYGASHRIIKIDPGAFSGSSLVNEVNVPKNRTVEQMNRSGIPSTYVPARNTLFLSYAAGQAEILGAQEIYFGPNAMDYHCYPDCRESYIQAFQEVLNCATKQAIQSGGPKLITPLIHLDKSQIIQLGKQLGAPLELTMSCYDPQNGKHCRVCDACTIRFAAFAEQASTIENSVVPHCLLEPSSL